MVKFAIPTKLHSLVARLRPTTALTHDDCTDSDTDPSVGSAEASPQAPTSAEPRVIMKDVGDGIRVGCPVQAFDGAIFHDKVTNKNVNNCNNKNYKSNNVGLGRSNANFAFAASRKPTAMLQSAAQPDYSTFFDSESDESLLQGIQLQGFYGPEFWGEVRNENVVNSNNKNYNSNNVGVRRGAKGSGPSYPTDAPDDHEEQNTAGRRRSKKGAKLGMRSPIQTFSNAKFMRPVLNKNTYNSNNENIDSNNHFVF